jgi:xylulokinase
MDGEGGLIFKMLYIGIDLGTSAVKLLLMDSEGKIVNIVSREYPLYFPHPGWSEQNPDDWYNETIKGINELLKDFDKSQVAGISFGGQMHGLVILDKDDNVIRPAILWNDGRTAAETDYLNNVIGKEKLSEYTANIAFAGFTAPKILWVKNNEAENFEKIDKIMLPKDYIAYRLTGVHCTDVSDASGTLLFDVKNRCWSKEMCEICGVKPSQLAKCFESYEAVGTVLPEIAEKLGIPAACKVAAGAGDNAAAAVGTGTVGDNMCNISLGTSGTIFISSKNFGVDRHNALHSFAHADGSYHLMGCMLSAASCNKWWMDEIIGTKDYAAEQEVISKLGENHVYFLPYLMGERSPHNNPNARATFIGMTMDTTRADMTQAVLEGVAFALRDSLEVAKSLGIDLKRTKICGGGAKSPLWKRIIANVLNLKVDVIESEEGPAMGGAMLAAVACGEYKSVNEIADKVVKIVETIEPDSELVEKYNERYAQFKEIYPACRPLFDIIN